ADHEPGGLLFVHGRTIAARPWLDQRLGPGQQGRPTPNGVLSDTDLKRAIRAGGLAAPDAFLAGQLQPASPPLRLGETAHRLRASFLPGAGASVRARLDDEIVMHQIDLRAGAVLETGCVYLVQVQEELTLPNHIHGAANPKSSTGRVDVFTRLITDGATAFDASAAGYHEPMQAEIRPCTLSLLVATDRRLSQNPRRRAVPNP